MFKFSVCTEEINMIQLYTELYIIILLVLFILIMLIYQGKKEQNIVIKNNSHEQQNFNFSNKEKELKILFKIFLISYKKIMLEKRPDSERRKDLEAIIFWYEAYLGENYLKLDNIVIDENFLKDQIEKSKLTIREIYNSVNE